MHANALHPHDRGLQNLTTPLSTKDKIYSIYHRAIVAVADFFDYLGLNAVTLVCATLLLEPHHAIKAALSYFQGCKRDFHPYGLNPHSLTADQVKKNPILLVHGAFHNQSGWLPLAKKFQDANLGPVYTVNLPSGWIGDKDYVILKEKAKEIFSHYEQQGAKISRIDVVTHSRGGRVLIRLADLVIGNTYNSHSQELKQFFPIGKMIKLGSVRWPLQIGSQISPVTAYKDEFEMTGKYDVIERGKSYLAADHHFEVNTGHLGLVYSDEAHQKIIDWLKI